MRSYLCLSVAVLLVSITGFAKAKPSSAKSPAPLKEKELAEYWAETKLPYKELHKILDLPSCHDKGVKSFKACMKAAVAPAGARSGSDEVLELVPNTLLTAWNLTRSDVIQQFGPLSLVRRPVSKLSPREEQKAIQARQAQLDRVLTQEIYPAQKALKDKIDLCTMNLTKEEEPSECVEAVYNDIVLFDEVGQYILSFLVKDEKLEPYAIALALNAYSEAFDGHSEYLPLDYFKDISSRPNRKISGIGLELRLSNRRFFVVNVFEGLPAIKSGIRPNDELLSVTNEGKEEPVAGKALNAVIDLIKGAPGTNVTLRLLRGTEEYSVTVTRAEFTPEVVRAEIRQVGKRKIGYLRLSTFMGDDTAILFENKLKSLLKAQVAGLIVDVRGNGGGLLDHGIRISEIFVGTKPIVQVEYLAFKALGLGRQEYVGLTPALTRLPMIVLIDSQSASASELFAGALQDNARAWIVGERSFGKGSVQSLSVDLELSKVSEKQIMRRETTALFYQPNGRSNQIEGIIPDFEVPSLPDATEDEAFTMREIDFVPDAIRADNPGPWRQPRPEDVAKVELCVGPEPKALSEYREAREKNQAFDYQLAVGGEILNCAIEVETKPLVKKALLKKASR